MCLQIILNYLLGCNLVIDGSFGAKTFVQVKALQRKYNLTVDGVVGVKTWGKIKEVLESG